MNDFWIMVIPFGKDNAIHQKELAERLKMKPEKLKAEIHKARLKGIEICSCTHGYYFPKDDQERHAFYNMQRKQAISRFITAKPIKSKLEEIDGQMELSDVVTDITDKETDGL